MMKKCVILLCLLFIVSSCHMEIPESSVARFEVRQEGAGLVAFLNKSSNATQYSWDFGDGSTETTTNDITQHKYTSGNFKVKLIARGDAGSNGTTQLITVNAGSAAVAPTPDFDFAFSGAQEAPAEVVFTNKSTGNITGYQWKINAGNVSAEKDFKYTFTDGGTYKVNLTANGPGGSRSVEKEIVVKAKGSSAPVARFTVSGGVARYTAVFNNISEHADTFLWNFDDGTTSTEKSPSHDFSKPGVYNVILMATGGGGANKVSGELVVLSPIKVTERFDGNDIASSTATLRYNGSDNLLSESDASNQGDFTNARNYEYNGNLVTKMTYNQTLKGAAGTNGTVTFKYNDLGQLVESNHRFTRPNNGYQTGDRGNNFYEYGANGLPTKITVDSTIYAYGADGVLTGISFIGIGTAQRTRIDNEVYEGSPVVRGGVIVSYAYTNGAYRNLRYDSKNQKIEDVFEDPSRGKKITETWRYDNMANPSTMESKFKGHPAHVQYGFGNNLNNVTGYTRTVQNTRSVGNESYTNTISYNNQGLPTEIRRDRDGSNNRKTFKYATR